MNLHEALTAVFGEPVEIAEGITVYAPKTSTFSTLEIKNMPFTGMQFDLGQTVATRGALGALEDNKIAPIVILARHSRGDWGDLDAEDKARNDAALIPCPETGECDRIFSAYILPDKQKVLCITEWNRSMTTILLPSEY
jgi:hypothetical protein